MTERCKNCNPSHCKNTNCYISSAHIAWGTVFDFVTEQMEKANEIKNYKELKNDSSTVNL